MKKDFLKKLILAMSAMILAFSISACESDDSDDGNDSGEVLVTGYQSGIHTISPKTNPYGVGIDLETGISFGIFDYPDQAYDLRVQTILTYETESTAVKTGNPHIKLYKQEVSGYEYSETGKTNFDAITLADVNEALLETDDVEEIDGTECYYSGTSKISYDLLTSYYDNNLVTGSRDNNWCPAPWVVDTDSVIFIIKTADAHIYKLIILGTKDAGSAPGEGNIELGFELLSE